MILIALYGGVMHFIQLCSIRKSLQGVKDCYNKWLTQINNKNPDIWILGKDYLDRPVEGNTLKEYLNEYHI